MPTSSLKFRITLVTLAVLLIAASLVGGTSCAIHRVPKFYDQALQTPRATLEKASDDFLRHTTAITGEVQDAGPWEAQITADEINGWLAVDLLQNHAHMIPPGFSDPRVQLEDGSATLACRYEGAWAWSVLTVKVDVRLTEPNVLVVRIDGARAGALPLPLEPILDAISSSAGDAEWQLEWLQSHGDPVAKITISPGDGEMRRYVDSVEIANGVLWMTGRTEPAPPDGPLEASTPRSPAVTR